MKVRIYVEGGGDNSALKTKCHQAFSAFFKRTNLPKMPKVIPCGGRNAAFGAFQTALAHAKPDEFVMLLVDSEGPIKEESKVWEYLRKRDKWQKPDDANEEHCHLMVQLMESWFLADREWLAKFYDGGFTSGSLPGEQNIEKIAKDKVMSSLEAATRNTKTKGPYDKSKHSFDILGGTDPAKVRKASPVHAERLFITLEDKLN